MEGKGHASNPANSCTFPSEFEERLKSERVPLRLSCISPYGWPVIVALWTHFDGECFICATQKSAKTVKYLRLNPSCGFELSSNNIPYWGIRGHGTVSIDQDLGKSALKRLLLKYVGNLSSHFARSLLEKSDTEVALIIRPKRCYSWDFSDRMNGLNAE